MNPAQIEKTEPKDQSSFLSRGARLVFTCLGFLLILQDVAIIVFFLQRTLWVEPWITKILEGWAALSILAVCWIMYKSVQFAESQTPSVKEPIISLGQPDANFSLPSLCAWMAEGLALVRAENILYANNSFSYLLGVQENELINTNIRSYIHPDDIAVLELRENKLNLNNRGQHLAQNSGKSEEHGKRDLVLLNPPTRSTLRMTTSLGDYRWVICSVHNILWEGEETSMLLFENLGPLKQVQRSLEEHEQQSRIFLERTPLAVAMFDALGQVTIANSAWYSVWSNVAGAIPKRFNLLQDSLLPRQDLETAIHAAFDKNDSGVTNLEHTTPWGETRWFNINFHPMLTSSGNLIGVIMIQQDITDTVRSARRENGLSAQLSALRDEMLKSQQQYTCLFDADPAAIICIDENEKIRIWNKAAEVHFKLNRQDVLSKEITLIGPKMTPYLSLLSKLTIAPDRVAESIKKYDSNDGYISETATAFRTTETNALTLLRIEKTVIKGENQHD